MTWVVVCVVGLVVVVVGLRARRTSARTRQTRAELAARGLEPVGAGGRIGTYRVLVHARHQAVSVSSEGVMSTGTIHLRIFDYQRKVLLLAAYQMFLLDQQQPAAASRMRDTLRAVLAESPQQMVATWRIVEEDLFDDPDPVFSGSAWEYALAENAPRSYPTEAAGAAVADALVGLIAITVRADGRPTEDHPLGVTVGPQHAFTRDAVAEVLAQYDRLGIPQSVADQRLRVANALLVATRRHTPEPV